jgi:PAS domain S-box-containing protein
MLELVATYAYDRKKYINKSVEIGDGLVGTCAIEKETIFLTDIPNDYINIKSGLGGANPKSIVIVPLKLEDKIFGVIELASFNIYEEYQIKFIEKLGESIASTLSVTKTNIITNKLLEQSKLQTEELAAAEEEMRQNMEEMTATQEQLAENSKENMRKNNELKAQMDAINKFALVSKTDPRGIITYVNDLFCEVAGYRRDKLIGKPHNVVRHPDMQKSVFENLWKTIKAGNVWSGKIKNLAKDGSSYLVDANISPIYDENGDLKEYIGIRYLINRNKI